MHQAAAREHDDDQRMKPRGKPWAPGQSGNPSGSRVSKRFTELFDAMLLDFGGELSAVERALLAQATHLMLRSERTRDNTAAVRLANASARLLGALRNTKRQRHPAPVESFADIAARAQAAADVRRAAELAADAEDDDQAPAADAPATEPDQS